MIDTKNINRVKGILSARTGAEIPTTQPQNFTPPKFQKRRGDAVIYSNDNVNWFQNIDLSIPYVGPTDGFISMGTVPGLAPTSPWDAVETAAKVSEKQADIAIEAQAAAQAAAQTAAQVDGSAANPETPSLNGQTQSVETGRKGRERTPKPEDPEREAKREGRKEKWTNAIGVGATAALQGIGTAVGAAQKATDSDTTKIVDTAYSAAAEGIKQAGPVGQVVGTAMQMGQFAGDIIQSLGGGTDQQTTTDKWMDSALFSWNIGMLNGFAGKNTQDFGVDQSIMSQVGGSYGDSVNAISEAASKAGKKYGLFSTKDRKKTDAAINLARSQQNAMGNIADTAATQRLAAQSMGEQAGLAYSLMTSGGYDQKYTYAAKQGGSLEWNPVIELDWEPTVEWEPQIELNWELPTFKEGGNIDINEELEWIPELQSGNKINLDEVRKYYKDYDLSNIEFITDKSPRTEGNKLYISNEEDAVHELWHYLSKNQPNEIYKDYYDNLNDDRIAELGGDLQFVKRFENDPGHFYQPSELEARIKAAKFKTQGQTYTKEFFQNLRKDENKYGNNMRDLLHMFNDDALVKIFNLKDGGKVEKEYPQEYLDFITDVAKYAPNLGNPNPDKYNLFRFWELNNKPKTFKQAVELGMFALQDDGFYHGNSVGFNQDTGEYEWIKEPGHETRWMERAFYDGYDFEVDENGDPIFSEDQPLYEGVRPILKKKTGEALKESDYFRAKYDLVEDENGNRRYVPKKFKDGGSIKDSDIPEIEETTQKNVIPEGALHKNKHHMEYAEGWTKKGIPVIDDDGEQQAEIEHSEIIFTLEVTKKLEEYYEIFYSDESSNKEKEQAALEAGKLLVYQILENTEDRTGLIDSCKKGGTLTLKKTTDDLIEEALEDMSAVVIVEEKEIVKTPKKKEEKSDKELMKEAIKEVLIELLTK